MLILEVLVYMLIGAAGFFAVYGLIVVLERLFSREDRP